MKCEVCSREVRPVVALDIDGTLGDYHAHFLNFLRGYTGIKLLPAGRKLYDGSVNFGDWVCETFQMDRRTYRDIKLAYRQGAQKRTMPAFRDAWQLSHYSRLNGAEVWVTTSRPYLRLDNIDPDTREWLDRHGIEYDHLLYNSDDKYGDLASQVDQRRVCAVLDDLIENLNRARVLFHDRAPILRRTIWNKAVGWDGDSASDIPEAWTEIRARIKQWQLLNK